MNTRAGNHCEDRRLGVFNVCSDSEDFAGGCLGILLLFVGVFMWVDVGCNINPFCRIVSSLWLGQIFQHTVHLFHQTFTVTLIQGFRMGICKTTIVVIKVTSAGLSKLIGKGSFNQNFGTD
ncbi:hypothetical protein PAHA111176_21920 [Parendozoicomonas haliclonae]|uniref:Uncharacterized protein n=1 Tax=Parendozoicomonas haliclonae TaxID=1960125 RepID=A0A1X7AR44_9GAMM|nr:hypothetical protein EHSB41UT_04430 [Parendozoicomonas haliclonae]